MSDNLVERLRNWEKVYDEDYYEPDGSLYIEAAKRIEELEEEIKELSMQYLSDTGQLGERVGELTTILEEVGAGKRLQMTEQNDWAVKMWSDTLEELSNKGDALMDIYNSVCIVRLRQVVEWSLEEMWRIKERKNITDSMWEDYAENRADLLAAKRLLEYFGASHGEEEETTND